MKCQISNVAVAVSSGRSSLPAIRNLFALVAERGEFKRYKVSKGSVTLGTDTMLRILLLRSGRTGLRLSKEKGFAEIPIASILRTLEKRKAK